MAIDFQILPNLNLIVVQPRGTLTTPMFSDYFDTVWSHPDFRMGLNRLVDNRYLEDVDLSYAEMCNLQRNEKLVPLTPDFPIQTVFVTYGGAGFGMARMYQSIAETRNQQTVTIFDDLESALRHLGIPISAYPVDAPLGQSNLR